MGTPARRRRSKLGEPPQFVLLLPALLALGMLLFLIRWLIDNPAILLLALAAGGTAAGIGIQNRVRRREQARMWKAEQARIQEARSREIASYHVMGPRQFEEAIAYLCERDGCTAVQVVGGRGDLGADVKAIAPDGRRLVIQCKRYGPTNKVGSGEMQKFAGTCYNVHQAHVATLVTTSTFTKDAARLGDEVRIGLYDADRLAGWACRTGPAPWM
jgi:restriction system protein